MENVIFPKKLNKISSLHFNVCVGLCWFVLVCVGLCWFVLICVGLCWFVLVCVGLTVYFEFWRENQLFHLAKTNLVQIPIWCRTFVLFVCLFFVLFELFVCVVLFVC